MARVKKVLDAKGQFAKEHFISTKTINKIVTYLGDGWEDKLRENPYMLMKYDSFGFYRADVIANKLGISKQSPYRIRAYVGNEVENNSNGSTLTEFDKMCKKTAKELGLDVKRVAEILCEDDETHYMLLNDKYVKTKENNPSYIVSEESYDTEVWFCSTLKNVANNFKTYAEEEVINKIIEGSGLNSDQEKVVKNILNSGVSVLTGKAGSGKSYTAKKILEVLDEYGKDYVCLAPTGIASKVFRQSTDRDCSTIHRKYYADFLNSGEKLYTDVLILEESGMYSVQHLSLIREMFGDVKQIIFIGDIYQLTPISQGCFLYSTIGMIKNKRIYGQVFELTKVMRTGEGSSIPKFAQNLCGGNNSSKIIEASDGDLIFKTIGALPIGKQVENIMIDNGFKFNNTYILTSMKVREDGTDAINKYFQDKNSGAVIFEDKFNKFKVGDIIMQTSNDYMSNIFNGEKLIIINKIYGRIVCEKLEDRAVITYDEKDFAKSVMLSYANTVHKTQGLTVENVIFIVSTSQAFMLNRNLLYTGITRASKKLVILRDDGIIKSSSYKNLIDKRDTITRRFGKIN